MRNLSTLSLVCFVPHTSLEAVKTAVFAAGAGKIGNYAQCAYSVSGVGQFKPLEQAKPAKGTNGEVHTEPETRIEFLVRREVAKSVVEALVTLRHATPQINSDGGNLRALHLQGSASGRSRRRRARAARCGLA